jgi:hypothetical protein
MTLRIKGRHEVKTFRPYRFIQAAVGYVPPAQNNSLTLAQALFSIQSHYVSRGQLSLNS